MSALLGVAQRRNRKPQRPLEWQHNAPCRDVDPEIFFPTATNSHGTAKRICRGCEIRSECLQYALDNRERYGVWGGMGEKQRRKLLKAGAA